MNTSTVEAEAKTTNKASAELQGPAPSTGAVVPADEPRSVVGQSATVGAGIRGPLAGWGLCPVETCWLSRPQTAAEQRQIIEHGPRRTYIPRGLGRSYGDSALNRGQGVVDQRGLARFRNFDPQTGLLDCEAGCSLDEIIRYFLPRGWWLPVTPGTKFVTVGGAIAADVHGKNHHRDGSFGQFVRQFSLLLASGEVIECSPEQNADIFWATVGGMGLTGIILNATVQLKAVESAYVNVTYRRTRDLDETLTAFSDTDQQYEYSVAWIDCLASGRRLGRSVLMLGNDAAVEDLPDSLEHRPLTLPTKPTLSVPFSFPNIALNSLSIRAFNEAFYQKHADTEKVVDRNSYFYPLDSILHWNRIYGRRGFVQYQALFPPETSRQGLIKLLGQIAASKRASFLAVLKSSGAANPGLLSFLYRGHTLALDFPYTGESLHELVGDLDRLLLKYGGRLYLAKDAMTTPEVFAEMYPRLDEFRAIKNRIDPEHRFSSSQARRLKIIERR